MKFLVHEMTMEIEMKKVTMMIMTIAFKWTLNSTRQWELYTSVNILHVCTTEEQGTRMSEKFANDFSTRAVIH